MRKVGSAHFLIYLSNLLLQSCYSWPIVRPNFFRFSPIAHDSSAAMPVQYSMENVQVLLKPMILGK